MDFTDFIIKKIQKSNYSYDKGYIKILNNIIYIICIRLLILMVQLTNHCNRNVIKKDAVHYASKIELKNIDYSPSLISNIPISFLEDIFKSKVISTFSISNSCLVELSQFLDYIIDYYIENSLSNNSFNISLLLNQLKKNNLFLYRFIVTKYNLNKYINSFF